MKNISYYILCVFSALVCSSCAVFHHHLAVTYNKNVCNAPFDVVIVPGSPYDTGKMNPLLKARMLWAKELYDNGITSHIIFSGSAVHTPYIEAVVMKIMADSMGIPTRHTFIEDKAMHSTENVDYGVRLARQMGFKKIAVATDPFQTVFLKKHLAKNHLEVYTLPFSIKVMPQYYKHTMPDFDACPALVKNFIPIMLRSSETEEGCL